jgi:hypothetical protein
VLCFVVLIISSNISGSMLLAKAIPERVRLCFFWHEGAMSLRSESWICCSFEGSQKMRGKRGYLLGHVGNPCAQRLSEWAIIYLFL